MCDLVKKFRDLEYDSDIAEDLLFRMPRIQKKKYCTISCVGLS